jgi:Dolichyl-phosphate-mannose-protein mannosyltransferase
MSPSLVPEHRLHSGLRAFRSVGRRLVDRYETRIAWLSATVFAFFFFSTNLYISHKRLLWFDEINTVNVARLPDLATLWKVQNSFRADSAPIMYHLLVRLFYGLSGHAESSVRFLSSVAMILAMLVVFDCARRLAGAAAGLIAFCVLGSSFLTYYGFEGRPYALVVLFAAIALWLWLHTPENGRPAAVAFGIAVFLAVTMHFQGVLLLVPFGIWVLFRWRPWRMPAPKLIAGVAGVICAVGISLGQMRHSSDWAAYSWCPPSLGALSEVFGEMFPYGLFILASFALLACRFGTVGRPDAQQSQMMTDAERLCWLFLTIPFAGYVLAEAVTNSFYNRYLITMLPGVAVAFACLASRHLNRLATIALLLLMTAGMGWRQIQRAKNAETIEPPASPGQQALTRQTLAAEDALVADGRKIIIAYPLMLDQAQYYSKRPQLYAMYGSEDPNPLYCKYFGSACLDLDAIKARVKEAAAINPTSKFLADMAQAGFQSTVKMVNPTVVYFSPR